MMPDTGVIKTINCPNCGVDVPVTSDDLPEAIDVASVELTCPKCGIEFEYEYDPDDYGQSYMVQKEFENLRKDLNILKVVFKELPGEKIAEKFLAKFFGIKSVDHIDTLASKERMDGAYELINMFAHEIEKFDKLKTGKKVIRKRS